MMADVKVKSKWDEITGVIYEMVHRCGELIQIESAPDHVICYRSMYGSRITECPHCLEVIEFDDLQNP